MIVPCDTREIEDTDETECRDTIEIQYGDKTKPEDPRFAESVDQEFRTVSNARRKQARTPRRNET